MELLIAMTLGLLLIAGIGQIYIAAKRGYDIQNSLARLQDVGRYVTEQLTQDIRRAGYWGIMDIQIAALTNEVAPGPTCTSDDTWGRMITEKIFGFDETSDMSGYACISPLRGDVLTVRYGNPSTTTPYPGSGLYIRTTPVSGVIDSGPAEAIEIDPTLDYELEAYVYYVAASNQAMECESASSPAPFLPALAREHLTKQGSSIGQPRKEELVTGVEQLQLQFGVDTDADGSINMHQNANDVSDWNSVRTVTFWVLVRDDCPETGYKDSSTYNMGNVSYAPGDNFRRALYTSTVTLRN